MKDITNDETEKSAEKPGVEAANDSSEALLGDTLVSGKEQPKGSDRQTNSDNGSGKSGNDSLFLSVMLDKVEDGAKALGQKVKSVYESLTESGDTPASAKAGPARAVADGAAKAAAEPAGAAVGRAATESAVKLGEGIAKGGPQELELTGKIEGLAKPAGNSDKAAFAKAGLGNEITEPGTGKGRGNAELAPGTAKDGSSSPQEASHNKPGLLSNIMDTASQGKGIGSGDTSNLGEVKQAGLNAGEAKSRGADADKITAETKPGAGSDSKGFWGEAIARALENKESRAIGKGDGQNGSKDAGEVKAEIVKNHFANSITNERAIRAIGKEVSEAVNQAAAQAIKFDKLADKGDCHDKMIGRLLDINTNKLEGRDFDIRGGKSYSPDFNVTHTKSMNDAAIVPTPVDATQVPFPPTKHEIISPREPKAGEFSPPNISAGGFGGNFGGRDRDVVTKGDIGPGGGFSPMVPNSNNFDAHFPQSNLNSHHDFGGLDQQPVFIPAQNPPKGGIYDPPAAGGPGLGQNGTPRPEPVQTVEKPPTATITGSGIDWLARPSTHTERPPQLAYMGGNDRPVWQPHDTHHEQKQPERVQENKAPEHKPEQKVEQKVEHKQEQAKLEQKNQPTETKQEYSQRLIDNAVKALVPKPGQAENDNSFKGLLLNSNNRLKIGENERTANEKVPVSNILSMNGKSNIKVPEHVSSNENAPLSNLHRSNGFNVAEAKAIIQPQLVQRAMEAAAKNTSLTLEHQPQQQLAQPQNQAVRDAAKGKFASAVEANNRVAGTADHKAFSLNRSEDAGKAGLKTWTPGSLKDPLKDPLKVTEKSSEGSITARQNALKQLAASAASADLRASGVGKDSRPYGIHAVAKQEMEAAQLLVNKLTGVVNSARSQGFIESRTIPGVSTAGTGDKGFNPPPQEAKPYVDRFGVIQNPVNKPGDTGFKSLDAGIKNMGGRKSEKDKSDEKEFSSRNLPEPSDLNLPVGDAAGPERTPAHTAFLLALVLSMSGMSRRRETLSTDGLEEIIYSVNLKSNDSNKFSNANRTLHRRTHMVESGDTLQSIAEKYFNDARIAWLIADLNQDNLDEHGIDEKRVVELKTRQSIELPEAIEVSEFLFSLPRDFDIDQKLVTLVTDTMVNLEVLKQFLGPLLGVPCAPGPEPKQADPRKDLLGDFTILGADCA